MDEKLQDLNALPFEASLQSELTGAKCALHGQPSELLDRYTKITTSLEEVILGIDIRTVGDDRQKRRQISQAVTQIHKALRSITEGRASSQGVEELFSAAKAFARIFPSPATRYANPTSSALGESSRPSRTVSNPAVSTLQRPQTTSRPSRHNVDFTNPQTYATADDVETSQGAYTAEPEEYPGPSRQGTMSSSTEEPSTRTNSHRYGPAYATDDSRVVDGDFYGQGGEATRSPSYSNHSYGTMNASGRAQVLRGNVYGDSPFSAPRSETAPPDLAQQDPRQGRRSRRTTMQRILNR